MELELLKSLIASGPVAAVLFYWVLQERKDKREVMKLNKELMEEILAFARNSGLVARKKKKELESDG